MINILKPKAKLYTNCEIPAKIFYTEVIGKSNLAALGEGTEEELQNAVYSIVDELCQLENNTELMDNYSRIEKISRIQSVITTIQAVLGAIVDLSAVSTNEQLLSRIELLNSIKYIRIKFDATKDIASEIKRVEESIIGMLNNQINTLKDVKQDKEQKIAYNFHKECARLEDILAPKTIDQNTTLYMYAEYRNLAKEKIKLQKNGK